MLLDDIKNIKSSANDLKKFGLTIGIFFVLLGCLSLWREKQGALLLFILALIFILPALLFPHVLRIIQKVWMTLALLMSWVMTRVLLSLVCYLVLTPIGLVTRLMGKKFLDIKDRARRDSYWTIRNPLDRKKEDCEKQY